MAQGEPDRESRGRAPRLLTVSNFFDTHRGGLEIVAGRLARELAAKGFEVSWLATRATPVPDDAGEVVTMPVGAWNIAERRLGVPFPMLGPAAAQRLFGEVRRHDAVLLHDSLYPISLLTALAAKLHRKPLVVIQHIGAVPYRNPLLRGLMAAANRCVARPLLAGADQAVFISEFVHRFFARAAFRRPPELVFNGVDAELFAPGDRQAARAGLQLDPDRPIALFVGRFVDKKGLHFLQRAAALRPDMQWVLAGWGVIDPMAWGLPNVRVFSDLSGRGLAELYRAADVFVLPSCGEGFPLVIQEALSCGLPVVCGAETLEADPAAAPFLAGVELAGDPDKVSRALVRTVGEVLAGAAHDRGAAAQRRELVVQRYAWSAAADRYAAILRRVIRDRRETRRVAQAADLVAGDAR
ncbi:MAG: glycosyltransferase family 4 protein [Caulobacterales bacterium]